MNTRLPPLYLAPRLLQIPYLQRVQSSKVQPILRPFHATHSANASVSNPTLYDILGISPSAPQGDVKAKFYDLSKTHHPDRNPSDPDAAKRFVAISEAYATIGNPAKRKKYDHEVLAPLQSTIASGGDPSHQVYHGSGHAGGRKASGLSRRRTQFRGPPTSFYRNGGWGAHGAKRSEHASASSASGPTHSPAGNAGTAYATHGDSSYPYAATDLNDVPHFDRDGHYKVQSTVEEQLRQGRVRRREAQTSQQQAQRRNSSLGFDFDGENSSLRRYEDGNTSAAGSFFVVAGVVMFGVGGPVLLLSLWDERQQGKGKRWGNKGRG